MESVGGEYPKREKYFAHRFVRLTHKECLAQQIGSDAVFLLSVIAFQEDVCRYKRAVTFYTHQLLPILGFSKWERLDRARKAAVDAGWLNYKSGGNRKAGMYFVTIPDHLSEFSDTPICEDFDTPDRGSIEVEHEDSVSLLGDQQGDRKEFDIPFRVSTGVSIYPIPIPIPIPEGEEGIATRKDEEVPDIGQGPHPLPSPELIQEVLEAWNDCPNTNRIKFLTEPRRRKLMARLRDGDFANHWRDGIEKITTGEFFSTWKPGFDWFLTEENFVKVLEGNYDHKARAGPSRNGGDEREHWIEDLTEEDIRRAQA